MRVCSVDGCDRKHRARGLCASHYNRARNAGGMANFRAKGRVSCEVPGCDRAHYSLDMCRDHYGFWRKTGIDLKHDAPVLALIRVLQDRGLTVTVPRPGALRL